MRGTESPRAVGVQEEWLAEATERYRSRCPGLTDVSSRALKAAKISAVLREFHGDDTSRMTCLDLGCGSGAVAAHLAAHFGTVVACDLDAEAVSFARAEHARPNVAHLVADAARVPLGDESCDVVVCAHVYEHVSSAEALVAEIHRVLKPDGVCFFSGPNALGLYEPHLRLWLVHWLPRPATNALLRLVGRAPYRERLRTRWGLARLLSQFDRQDLNPVLVEQARRFHTHGEPGMRLARLLPSALRRPLLALLAPSFNLLLRPKKRLPALPREA